MPSLSIWNHWKNNLFFMIWVIFWNISGIDLFSFLAFKILRAIVTLFFANFFQSTFSGGKFIPSQLYLFMKVSLFVILCGSFWFFQDLPELLPHNESICYLFYWWDLLLLFFSNRKNLYEICHDSDICSFMTLIKQ